MTDTTQDQQFRTAAAKRRMRLSGAGLKGRISLHGASRLNRRLALAAIGVSFLFCLGPRGAGIGVANPNAVTAAPGWGCSLT
jgi:hypothetical protein